MKPGVPMERWTERAATPAEERAAASLRALREEPDLDGLAQARLQNRILLAVRPVRRRAGWRWQPALLALLTLGVAGIAAATIGAVVVARKKAEFVPLPSSAPEKSRRVKVRGPVVVQAGDAGVVAAPVEAGVAAEVAAPEVEVRAPLPAPVRQAEVRTHAAPPAAAPDVDDGEEVRMFSTAMRAWRAGDARGALAGIEDYQNMFPRGHFAHEAIVVKVDALQVLGRSVEALAFLRYLSLDRLPRALELHVIRGELAAKAHLCDEALVDFDRVLKRDPGGSVGARALYARASCRARLGDEVGAESDLRVYLLRYPAGAHVAEVRRALAR
jgi:hypothetical protein